MGLGFSDEVHPRRQCPHVIRTGHEVRHPPTGRVEQYDSKDYPQCLALLHHELARGGEAVGLESDQVDSGSGQAAIRVSTIPET